MSLLTRVHGSALRNWQLFTICVGVWGTTWYAITFQLGHVAAEVGVAYRFALAGAAILAGLSLRGRSTRLSLPDHAYVALQGCLLYGVAYLGIYHAERYLPSGVVAVAYSAAPLLAGVGARLLWGTSLTSRFVLGGLLGLAGVALLFWREIGSTAESRDSALGGLLALGAVLASGLGNLAASRNQVRGLPFWPALAWGMLYGASTCFLAAFFNGASFVMPIEVSWWISLFYLALLGSVLTFASFLKLQERIGPGRAGAVGVMTPLVALSVSVVFEAYQIDLMAISGALLALLGNVLMLRRTVAPAPGQDKQ
jgi:drug/metabolite transporter (DMT)-like permease